MAWIPVRFPFGRRHCRDASLSAGTGANSNKPGEGKNRMQGTLLGHWSVAVLVGPGSWLIATSFSLFRRATADRHRARIPSLTR